MDYGSAARAFDLLVRDIEVDLVRKICMGDGAFKGTQSGGIIICHQEFYGALGVHGLTPDETRLMSRAEAEIAKGGEQTPRLIEHAGIKRQVQGGGGKMYSARPSGLICPTKIFPIGNPLLPPPLETKLQNPKMFLQNTRNFCKSLTFSKKYFF